MVPVFNVMIPSRKAILAATCFAAFLTVLTAIAPSPQALRIVLGILIVFLLPGFAIISAVLPYRPLSHGERLLASLGISLGFTTVVAVILGITPIGISRDSVAVALGSSTVMISVYAWFRVPTMNDGSQSAAKGERVQPERDCTSNGVPPDQAGPGNNRGEVR